MKERQDELQDYFRSIAIKRIRMRVSRFNPAYRRVWGIKRVVEDFGEKERDEIDSILSDVAFMGRQLGCIYG